MWEVILEVSTPASGVGSEMTPSPVQSPFDEVMHLNVRNSLKSAAKIEYYY